MKFRHFYLAVLSLIFLQSQAQADGLPYTTSEAGERVMHGDFIALTISDAQTTEISKAGTISFTGDQLKKLRAFYPEFPAVVGVASSTFNDNLERFEAEADVIWWYPDEVRVPLITSPKKNMGMPSGGPWCPLQDALVRIAPDATPYQKGQKTSYREILAVIDKAAAVQAKHPNERPSLRVIVPPPHRGWAEADKGVLKELFSENVDTHPNKVIPRIFDLLEAYARTRGVELHKSW